MKAILRNSLLATLVAATGIVLGAGSAFAQAVSEDVNFDGLVGNACTFSNPQDGSLTDNGSLSSNAPGSVDLLCTGGASLSVSLPNDNGSSPDISATAPNMEASVENQAQGIFANNSLNGGSNPSFIGGPVNTTLEVNMFIDANGGFVPAGSYNYTVTVTATPQ